MLRQIVLVSLATIACATLLPIEANAAVLTFTDFGITKIKKSELSLKNAPLREPYVPPRPDPDPEPEIGPDPEFPDPPEVELELPLGPDPEFEPEIGPFNPEIELEPDLEPLPPIDIDGPPGDYPYSPDKPPVSPDNPLIPPLIPPQPQPSPPNAIVPEPLTIFGTATALGWGVLLKRKSFKKKKS